ncbi:hypothetical protein RHGRI_017429 [Rhododendron griersonianum]|uniref:Uncharacterized protein n=1 Tax=Rhododendron griersonianum TaxID=479676 RepID=A0AAV6JXT0_9ERIC|nr:hypothetical protein RHGRI_017429 [Rhododendron griersonianum]
MDRRDGGSDDIAKGDGGGGGVALFASRERERNKGEKFFFLLYVGVLFWHLEPCGCMLIE